MKKILGKYQNLLYPIGVFFVGMILIFYKFAVIPQNLSFDEVEFAKLALSLDSKQYSVYSIQATGHSTLYFYIILASLKIFGINTFALRLPSAVFGVLNGLILFIILSRIYRNKMIAFFTVCLFLSMRWYFNFARFSFEATFLLFLELVSLMFILKFLSNRKKPEIPDLIISGIFAGLSFHSYYPGRIFFILPLLIILMTSAKKYVAIFLICVGMIILPLISYTVMHTDVRMSQISFLSDPEISIQNKVNGMLSNISKTALMPFLIGDMNGRHNFPGKPAVNPIPAMLFAAGIVSALKKRSSLTWFLYLLISIIPTLLTSPNDNPNMLRTFTVLPAFVYFAGLAFLWMQNLFRNIGKLHLFYPVIVIVILLSAGYELRTYYTFQSRVFKNSFEVTCPLAEVVKKEIVPIECRVRENKF